MKPNFFVYRRKRKLQHQEEGGEEPRKKRPYNKKPKPTDSTSDGKEPSGDQSRDQSEVPDSSEMSNVPSCANSLDVSRDESFAGGEDEWSDEEGGDYRPPPAKRSIPAIKHVSPMG